MRTAAIDFAKQCQMKAARLAMPSLEIINVVSDLHTAATMCNFFNNALYAQVCLWGYSGLRMIRHHVHCITLNKEAGQPWGPAVGYSVRKRQGSHVGSHSYKSLLVSTISHWVRETCSHTAGQLGGDDCVLKCEVVQQTPPSLSRLLWWHLVTLQETVVEYGSKFSQSDSLDGSSQLPVSPSRKRQVIDVRPCSQAALAE
eukprot:2108785-Amphidinium_carterae.1